MNKVFKNKYFVIGFMAIIILITTFIIVLNNPKQTPNQGEKTSETIQNPTMTTPKKVIFEPLESAKERVTKKPFGIFITPQSSPVQPEKFTGYHTGTDFETTPAEASADVVVSTICSGKIRTKQFVSGYGGVIVQDCMIEGQTVTVLYGHMDIRLDYVPQVGQEIAESTKIAMLAPASSEYSGGERKHLHLGIHKGSAIDYRGYVQSQTELTSWLDANKYL